MPAAGEEIFAEPRARGCGEQPGPRSTFYSSRPAVCVCACGKRARRSGLPAMPCALAAPEVHVVKLTDCTCCESLVPTGTVLTFVRARIRSSVALHAARMLLTRLALDSHECGSVVFHVRLPPSCSFFDGALLAWALGEDRRPSRRVRIMARRGAGHYGNICCGQNTAEDDAQHQVSGRAV